MINYGLIRDKASAFRSALQNEYGTDKISSELKKPYRIC